MKQGGQTAEGVINKFRILKSHTKIQDSPLTVRMFRQALNPSLAMKIMTDPDKANLLEDTKTALGTINQHGLINMDGSPKPSNMIKSTETPEPLNEKITATTTISTGTETFNNQFRKGTSGLGAKKRPLPTETQMQWTLT